MSNQFHGINCHGAAQGSFIMNYKIKPGQLTPIQKLKRSGKLRYEIPAMIQSQKNNLAERNNIKPTRLEMPFNIFIPENFQCNVECVGLMISHFFSPINKKLYLITVINPNTRIHSCCLIITNYITLENLYIIHLSIVNKHFEIVHSIFDVQ